MDSDQIYFSGHAVQRMFERKISEDDVIAAIASGEVIKEYPDDTPYPSMIILGLINKEPVHVVAAFDKRNKTCYVITVYRPNAAMWDNGFKKKVKK